MKKKICVSMLLSLLASLILAEPSSACTDFLVKSADGSSINGRSMEWGVDLKSNIWLHARGESMTSHTPSGASGLSWKSRYGYLGVDANNMPLAVDGLNEKGLSLGLLWQPGAVYQDVPAGSSETALNLLDLGHWVLGNFSTVDEVKAAIAKLRIWAPQMAEWGGIPTETIATHD